MPHSAASGLIPTLINNLFHKSSDTSLLTLGFNRDFSNIGKNGEVDSRSILPLPAQFKRPGATLVTPCVVVAANAL